MLGRLLLTAAVVLAAIHGSAAQFQPTQNKDIAMTECPDGQPLVHCTVDPCSTVLCPARTQCVSNYCGGCNAVCVPIKPPVRCTSWTNWFDRDNPSVTGDWETLSNLQEENPGMICKAPTAIEARVVGTGQDALATGENFAFCDATTGFVCRKDDQPDNECLDYEVRFCCPETVPDCPAGSWTPWFDRDNPSVTGDWETLGSLRKENPGRICFSPTAVHARHQYTGGGVACRRSPLQVRHDKRVRLQEGRPGRQHVSGV
ncbi:mucin-5AC-like [Branchiostoma floridae]|uniref:Mucin-5AC-like n=1 Tax=Branchiostoma floridae TaxID=7739 RepID=A0A9J7MSZ1_BRAFL|nr:mucin-5AC-like [Branchiostoma floridae]